MMGCHLCVSVCVCVSVLQKESGLPLAREPGLRPASYCDPRDVDRKLGVRKRTINHAIKR